MDRRRSTDFEEYPHSGVARHMIELAPVLLVLTLSLHAETGKVFAKQSELLKTGVVSQTTSDISALKNEVNRGYFLAYESHVLFGGAQNAFAPPRYRIRVWDMNQKSWPGSQPQIIQLLDESSIVRAAGLVGEKTWMTKAWAYQMPHSHRIFVYIQSRYRQGATPEGVHIYELAPGSPIKEGGIFWPESEAEKQRPAHQKNIDDYDKNGQLEVSP